MGWKRSKSKFYISQRTYNEWKRSIITGSDFLIDGGATASYYHGKLKPET